MKLILFFVYQVLASLRDEILLSHNHCKEDHKHFKGETLAYVTPWNGLGYSYALKYPSKFNYVSPVWYEISFYYSAGDFDFSIAGEENSEFISKAKGQFKILPRLIITKSHPRAYLKLLKDDDFIARLAEGLSDFAIRNSYQGLVLEFWLQGLGIVSNLPEYNELRSLQLRMLTKVTKTMHKSGLKVIITIPPMRFNEITPKEFYVLLEHFDKVNLMTYDFSQKGSGPNSPLNWINELLFKIVQGNDIDYNKILLGIPFYGYNYKDGNANPILGHEFIEILKTGAQDIWLEDGKEHKFLYNNKGKECELYYPTLHMIQERLNLAEKYGMGIAIWEIGQGLEYFFSLL